MLPRQMPRGTLSHDGHNLAGCWRSRAKILLSKPRGITVACLPRLRLRMRRALVCEGSDITMQRDPPAPLAKGGEARGRDRDEKISIVDPSRGVARWRQIATIRHVQRVAISPNLKELVHACASVRTGGGVVDGGDVGGCGP